MRRSDPTSGRPVRSAAAGWLPLGAWLLLSAIAPLAASSTGPPAGETRSPSTSAASPTAPDQDEQPTGETNEEATQKATDETAAPDGESARPGRMTLFEELLVVGTPEQAGRVPGSAHVITRPEVERLAHDDVHRILRRLPGINIQEEEGYGLRPNIGLRGTGVDRSQKITLLEDGVLIAPAPYAAPSAYYTPTAGRMEGFEVRKGSSSIRQGPYTNGGALNYLSTSIPGDLGGRLQLGLGDEATRRARGWVGDSGERWGWLLETYQLETDGFKRLDGGGETGFDLADYLAKARYTSRPGARRFHALELKLGHTEQSGHETYLGLAPEDFRRDPFRRYAASAGDRIRTEHRQVQLSHLFEPALGWSLTTTFYRNDFFRNWHKLESVDSTAVGDVLADPEAFAGELAVLRGERDSGPGALAVRNNRRDYYSQGVQTVLAWQPRGARPSPDLRRRGPDHRLELGIRYHEDQEDRFQEDDRYEMTGGRRLLTARGLPGSQSNRIAAAEAVAVFLQDAISWRRWTLTPGVRVESIQLERRDFGTADPDRSGESLAVRGNDLTEVMPGLGVEYRLADDALLFFGVHRGFSPPAPGSTAEVRAEESLNYELGWRYRRASTSAELVGFWSDYDNLLGSDTVSAGGGGTGDQFNGGAVRVRGLEAALGLDLARRPGLALPLRLAYTYTAGEFESSFETDFADWSPRVETGDRLPYLPEHQLYAGLSLEGERWALHLDGTYAAPMRSKAGRGPIPEGEKIDGRRLLDLRAEYGLRGRYRLFAQVLNLTDETYVAARRPAGLRPGRPRAMLLGLTLDLGSP